MALYAVIDNVRLPPMTPDAMLRFMEGFEEQWKTMVGLKQRGIVKHLFPFADTPGGLVILEAANHVDLAHAINQLPPAAQGSDRQVHALLTDEEFGSKIYPEILERVRSAVQHAK